MLPQMQKKSQSSTSNWRKQFMALWRVHFSFIKSWLRTFNQLVLRLNPMTPMLQIKSSMINKWLYAGMLVTCSWAMLWAMLILMLSHNCWNGFQLVMILQKKSWYFRPYLKRLRGCLLPLQLITFHCLTIIWINTASRRTGQGILPNNCTITLSILC